MKRFGYRPLHRPRSEIRLVKLLPKDENEKLKYIPVCYILHASLHDKPKFVALSYVWGAATEERMILVDDSQFRVTKNLYDTMMVLRLPKEYVIIWIDFLCINQSENKEKSWQVRLMAYIYQQASKVVAWLGPAKSDSDLVMDYLNSFGAKAEACGIDNGPELAQKLWQKQALQPSVPHGFGRSKVMIRTLAAETLVISQNALNILFYSISGWYDQDNLLPTAGMKRLFTRP